MNTAESSPLIHIQIASPCHADWSAMKGDAVIRHCQSCQKNVYNISEMNRAAAEKLIRENEGNVCVRFYRRADGTIITDDCPVGVQVVKRSIRWISSAAAAGIALALGFLPGIARSDSGGKPRALPNAVPAHGSARHRKVSAPQRRWLMGHPRPIRKGATMGLVPPRRPVPSEPAKVEWGH